MWIWRFVVLHWAMSAAALPALSLRTLRKRARSRPRHAAAVALQRRKSRRDVPRSSFRRWSTMTCSLLTGVRGGEQRGNGDLGAVRGVLDDRVVREREVLIAGGLAHQARETVLREHPRVDDLDARTRGSGPVGSGYVV